MVFFSCFRPPTYILDPVRIKIKQRYDSAVLLEDADLRKGGFDTKGVKYNKYMLDTRKCAMATVMKSYQDLDIPYDNWILDEQNHINSLEVKYPNFKSNSISI